MIIYQIKCNYQEKFLWFIDRSNKSLIVYLQLSFPKHIHVLFHFSCITPQRHLKPWHLWNAIRCILLGTWFWHFWKKGNFQISGDDQWQIQDFTDGGANPWVWTKNLLFDKIFAENWMNMKEIGPKLDLVCPPPDPPMVTENLLPLIRWGHF